ncbi:MAG: DEAD/DEAH box helicase, partial [Gammaproteobacteria bacterium]|nr:DEAD/DEAH box helicase [Gammaproteobacteria bacterium]
MSNESDELKRLRAENARLIALLESHDIDWLNDPAPPAPSAFPPPEPSNLSTAEKVSLFRHLFRGRTDVYPVRWESATTGRSGYAPACGNEWRPVICEKPRIKCADCGNRSLTPVSDAVIYSHLAGENTIGVSPLLQVNTCHFLADDFDKAEWCEDAKAFVQSCRELDVPVALELSRSGNGAHAWIFFTTAVPARDARRLGTVIISHTCSRTRQLSLTSY